MFCPSLLIVVSISIPNHSNFVKPNKFHLHDSNHSVSNSQNKNTIEYNYITNQEYIRFNILKYQDIIP